MRYSMTFSTLVLAAIAAATPAFAAGTSPEGIWISDNGKGAIEIKTCGSKLCGHLVWIKDPADQSRGCRKQIIGDVTSSGGGVWDGGWVYSPERGRRYDVELKATSNDTLRVVGFAGTKLFSKTMIWTKAPADLKRCDVIVEAAKPAPAAAAPVTATVAAKPAVTAPVETKTVAAPVDTKPAPPVVAALPSTLVTKPVPAKVEAPAQPVTTVPAPAQTAPVATPAPQPAPLPQVAGGNEEEDDNEDADKERPKSADASDDTDEPLAGIIKKIASLEGGKDGYGLKKKANGKCRLKVPYVTIDIPCDR